MNDLAIAFAAILMIIGVISTVLWAKKMVVSFVGKKTAKKALYEISFYSKDENGDSSQIRKDFFSIIPRQDEKIIIPIEEEHITFRILNVYYDIASLESNIKIDLIKIS